MVSKLTTFVGLISMATMPLVQADPAQSFRDSRFEDHLAKVELLVTGKSNELSPLALAIHIYERVRFVQSLHNDTSWEQDRVISALSQLEALAETGSHSASLIAKMREGLEGTKSKAR